MKINPTDTKLTTKKSNSATASNQKRNLPHPTSKNLTFSHHLRLSHTQRPSPHLFPLIPPLLQRQSQTAQDRRRAHPARAKLQVHFLGMGGRSHGARWLESGLLRLITPRWGGSSSRSWDRGIGRGVGSSCYCCFNGGREADEQPSLT